MGIKRCPYCRALISEEDQYCQNCGTQLLFPEDEDLEEEIPGEKIVQDLTKETAEEESEEELDIAEENETQAQELQGENGLDDWEELDEPEAEEEKVILVDENDLESSGQGKNMSDYVEEKEKKGRTPADLLFGDEKTPLLFPEETDPKQLKQEQDDNDELNLPASSSLTKKVEEIEKEVLTEVEKEPISKEEQRPGFVTMVVESLKNNLEEKEEITSEEKTRPGPVTEMIREIENDAEEKGEDIEETLLPEEKIIPEPPGKEIPTLSSAELDSLGPTVDLGKHQVEEFFEILENKEKEAGKKAEVDRKNKPSKETGEVPPWLGEVRADALRDLDLEENQEDLGETTEEETEQEEMEEVKPSQPTMGFPERLTRGASDFAEVGPETAGELETTGEIEDEEEEVELESGSKEYVSASSETVSTERLDEPAGESKSIISTLGFKNYVKAKLFDLLFVGLFWLISIWLAARSLGTTIFRLMDVAASGLLVYLLILTVTYFFLFYFFIGETLGDRLFKEEEGEESRY